MPFNLGVSEHDSMLPTRTTSFRAIIWILSLCACTLDRLFLLVAAGT